jgi:hypothetical protein
MIRDINFGVSHQTRLHKKTIGTPIPKVNILPVVLHAGGRRKEQTRQFSDQIRRKGVSLVINIHCVVGITISHANKNATMLNDITSLPAKTKNPHTERREDNRLNETNRLMAAESRKLRNRMTRHGMPTD